MKGYIDITNQKFGKLTVKSFCEEKSVGLAWWNCLCDCGNPNFSVHRGTALRSGKVKSCGYCNRYEMIGKRFGKLVVKSFSHSHGHGSYFECECDCGNICVVESSKLKEGHTKSCGCILFEKNKFKKQNKYDLSGEYGIGFTKKGEEFYFDIEDYELIKDYYWGISSHGYMINNGKYLHRIIMNAENDVVVDHINHNLKDCRKCNLRLCNRIENAHNVGVSKRNTSRCRGVSYIQSRKSWTVSLMCNGKAYRKGGFKTFEDAIEYRKYLEEKYYGEFSYSKSMKNSSEVMRSHEL